MKYIFSIILISMIFGCNKAKVEPLQSEKKVAIFSEKIEPVVLEKSYLLRNTQIRINMYKYQILDPKNKFNEIYERIKELDPNHKNPLKRELENLDEEKDKIIKKYNIELNLCYLHKKIMSMSVIKHFDTQVFDKYRNVQTFYKSYSLAHKNLFPFSNEPIYRFSIECGVGFDFTPSEISIYNCDECNKSRDIWVKKNVN
jgi:hypothetical protein